MSLEGRHVVIVEDIVDIGRPLLHIMEALKRQVASASVATLLFKSCCLRYSVDSLK